MAANTNMHSLTTLIKRLEAATSRLEDMAPSVDSSHPLAVAAVSNSDSSDGSGTSAMGSRAGGTSETERLPASIEDFDKIIDEEVAAFVAASEKVGGLVHQQAKAVAQAVTAERTYLYVTTKAKKPSPQPPELLTELHTCTGIVDELRETNRGSPLFTHLSTVSEGIIALGWIVEPKPADFVKDTLGAAQYFGNKILAKYKEKDRSHIEFVQAYYRIFNALVSYVKQHFPRGLTWSDKDGIDAIDALRQIQSGTTSQNAKNGSATTSSSGSSGFNNEKGPPAPPPPPPPPLPPPPPPPAAAANGSSRGGDMTAVFDQLNKGSSVTSGLRKVDRSQMTHKNPTLRAGSVVPAEYNSSQNSISASSSSTSQAKSSPNPSSGKSTQGEGERTAVTKKPPRKTLDGSQWVIENFDNTGPGEMVEVAAERSHSIIISRCHKTVIRVTGKANAISIDNCSGLSILINSLVSSIEVIKATKFQLQIDGVVPSVLLDQVDAATVYLGRPSVQNQTEVFTSKCSGVNVVLPPSSSGDEDDKECPIPEQIRSVVKDGVLIHEVVEHAG